MRVTRRSGAGPMPTTRRRDAPNASRPGQPSRARAPRAASTAAAIRRTAGRSAAAASQATTQSTNVGAAPQGSVHHAAGVERLLASYRAIPPASVRLAKRTSNLFRAAGGDRRARPRRRRV